MTGAGLGPVAQDFVGEDAPAERLGDDAPERLDTRDVLRQETHRVAGDQHERHIGHERRGLVDELKAIQLRHVVVGDDDTGIEAGQLGKRRERTREGVDGCLQVLHQHRSEEIDVGFFVVNEYDGFRGIGTHKRDLCTFTGLPGKSNGGMSALDSGGWWGRIRA